jgi:hypothetical protein
MILHSNPRSLENDDVNCSCQHYYIKCTRTQENRNESNEAEIWYSNTEASSTLIILFSEMLKFSNMFLPEIFVSDGK